MQVREARFAARDRLWLGVNSIQLVTPAQPIDLDGMRERIRRLAEQEPRLRYFCRPGGAPDRYRQALDARAALALGHDIVRPLPVGTGPGTPLEASVSHALTHDDGESRAIVYVGDGIVGHRLPHALGDGLGASTHLRRLSTGPDPDSTMAPFPLPSAVRPLPMALAGRYLDDGLMATPRRLLADLRMPRPVPPTGPTGPADPAWNPAGAQVRNDVHVVIRTVGAQALAALRAWRNQRASGASTTSVQVAAIRRGLADVGLIPADDGMFMAFDLRGTLPQGADGNFVSVPYLEPDDPLDPVAISAATRAASASGLPLVQFTRGAVKVSLSRRTPVPAMLRPANRRTVAFSHLRIDRILPAEVTRRPDGVSMVVAAAMPPEVSAMSFMLLEHGGELTVTAVFCSPFTRREPVEQVLDRFSGDPIGLLG
ncbi:hypothetical protein ACIB24_14875 [Spongisporangium articulatum]|uniref:Uncharacterized protein n=1 Tax=Spongisporangium articulatum TaxID=3362603 RepID=A0ABW8APP9_9ACTN